MKLALKKFKALIGAVIAAILVFVLAHPAWLPLSETTRQHLVELEKTHFLIERSGKITAAHIVTLLMALFIGAISGGLISAILLHIPGTPNPHTAWPDQRPLHLSCPFLSLSLNI